MFIPQMTDFNLSELAMPTDLCRTVDRLMDRTDQISVRDMDDQDEVIHKVTKSDEGLLQTVPLEWVTTETRSCKCHKIILPKTNRSVRCGLCGSAVEYPYTKRELKSRSEETMKANLKEIVKKHREKEAAKEAMVKAAKEAEEDARRGYPALRRALAEKDEAERQEVQARNKEKINQRLKDAKRAALKKITFTKEELQDSMTRLDLLLEGLTGISLRFQQDKECIENAELEAIRRMKGLFTEPIDTEVN